MTPPAPNFVVSIPALAEISPSTITRLLIENTPVLETSTSPDGFTDVATLPDEPTRIFPSVNVVVCFPFI